MKLFTSSLTIVISVAVAAIAFCAPRSVSAQCAYQSLGVPAYDYPSSGYQVEEDGGVDYTALQTGLTLYGDFDEGFPTVNYMIIPAPYTGTSADPNYVSAVEAAQAAGVTVLGYVPTDEGLTSSSTVEGYVRKEMNWYNVDGIFFDQANCTTANETYYTTLKTYTKGFFSSAIVVLNQGGQITDSNYGTIADILVTFEGNWTSYDNAWTETEGTALGGASDLYFTNYNEGVEAWYSDYGNQKFWHIVYGVPPAELSTAISLSQSRNAGTVFITDEIDGYTEDPLPPAEPAAGYTAVEVPNPILYQDVPGNYSSDSTYLSTELSLVAAY